MGMGRASRWIVASLATVGIAASTLLGASTAGAQGAPPPERPSPPAAPEGRGTDRLIVRTNGGNVPNEEALASDAGPSVEPGEDVDVVRKMADGSWVVQLPERASDQAVEAIAKRWSKRDDVVFAEPDHIRTATRTPNDTNYGLQWHYSTPTGSTYGANLPPAWDVTTGSSSVTVAVVDTGRTNHPDLASQYVAGYDFISDTRVSNDGNLRDSDASDPGDWITSTENASGFFAGCGVSNSSWHGTHVSGTVGAISDNSTGVAGVAWGVKILPVRVLGKCGGYDSDIIDGVRWAAGLTVSGVPANANPAQIINLSLGGTSACSTSWQNAVTAVTGAGATMVVAAGNENVNASGASPGNCAGVITVASSGSTGSRAYYSNYGATVEITAPGGDFNTGIGGVLSTLNAGTTSPSTHNYAYYQGTSMAAPHVAGVAALIKSVRPSTTPAQMLSYLQSNVTPFPAGSTCTTSICGTGILNANLAVRAASSPPGTPGTPTATAANSSALVSWSAPASAGTTPITGYTVTPYVGGVAQTARVFASTATSQTITGLANGTTYTFRVAATNMIGTGTASADSNAVTPATLPGPPGTPTATAGEGEATVSWTAPLSNGGSPITGYRVTPYNSGFPLTARTFDASTTTRVIDELINGQSYTFRVAAVNGVGTGPDSVASNAVTPQVVLTVPGPPPAPQAFAGDGEASVYWGAPEDDGRSPVTGYTLYAYVDGVLAAEQSFGATAFEGTFTGLTNGTTYTFRVAAVNAIGTGAQSPDSDPVTPEDWTMAPDPPSQPLAVAGDGEVELSWTPGFQGSSPIIGYVVTPYVGEVAQAPRSFASTATTQTVDGLTNGTTYRFTVAAVNSDGQSNPSSLSDEVTPQAPITVPGAPDAPSATAGDGEAMVSWSAPADDGGSPITGYLVTPYVGAVAQTAREFDATSTTRTIDGLANGTTYTFTVAAVNAVGAGDESDPSNAVTPDDPDEAPGAPTGIVAVPGDATATVTWTAPASAGTSPITGYVVTPYIGGVPQPSRPFASTATTQTITGLTNGTLVSFRVAAVNAVGTGPDSVSSREVWPHTGVPQVHIGDVRVVEGSGTALVPVTVSKPLQGNVTVGTKPGTALAGSDFTAISGLRVNFTLAGGLTQLVPVQIAPDTEPELVETLQLVATSWSGDRVSVVDMGGTITVVDDDGLPPQITIDDVPSVDEGQTAVYTVRVRGQIQKNVSVPFSTAGGTAVSGADYNSASGNLSFTAGEVDPVRTISVVIRQDTEAEGVERLNVKLTARPGLTFADDLGTAYITSNDGGTGNVPTTPRVRIDDARVIEDAGVAEVTLRLDQSVDTNVVVNARNATAGSLATVGADFTGGDQTVTFTAGGPLTQTVLVPIADDGIGERDEIFHVAVKSASRATIADQTAVVTILDADGGPPTIRISDVRVTEGQVASFLITVDGVLGAPVTITPKLAPFFATSPADYGAISSSSITLPAGVSGIVRTVTTTTVADGVAERALGETFEAKVTVPSGAVIDVADKKGIGTIFDP